MNEFPFHHPVGASESSFHGTPVKETTFTSPVPSRQHSVALFGHQPDPLRHSEDQESFGQKRETLATALDGAIVHVEALQSFNEAKWTIHYPHQLGLASATSPGTASVPTTPRKGIQSSLRRSASVAIDSPEARPLASRAYSTDPAVPAPRVETATSAHPLSILSLDLTLGHPSLPTTALPALLPTLSLSTLSGLLSRRLTTSLSHLGALKTRVMDTSSRLLITGDLNAGKSTLVNALLGRSLMPADQQPLTTVFTEVLDAESYNGGTEEIHALRDVAGYDPANPATFDRFALSQVQEIQDLEHEPYVLLKAYVTDARAEASFIKNGLVSISLIDAPGLNRDTLSTTAIFARQAEIDVVVFVVNAENHFTLSAKEFLFSAGREKAYVFIVVNKWAGIRDKKRCERTVGEQIKQLSPATWEARDELVHFVDAASALTDEEDAAAAGDKDRAGDESWTHLEQSLRSFVLLKRTTSKLAPAKHYLLNLLSDLQILASSNEAIASAERDEATERLARVRPVHERLEAAREQVEHDVDAVEEGVVQAVSSNAWTKLDASLTRVEKGEAADLPEYPGFFAIWSWATDVKAALVRSLEADLRAVEDEARTATAAGVSVVMHDLAAKFLPPAAEIDGESHVEARTFRPEVMFAKRRRGVGRLALRGVPSGLGLGTAGVGSNFRATDFDVSFLDLFDLERVWGAVGSGKKADESDALESTAIISLGLGGVGMIGSQMLGLKGALDSIARVCDVLGSKQAREWAAPVIAVLTVGLGAYLVYDLPRALPRNIGRKLTHSLSSPTAPPTTFATAHSDRISRESRKVLRLAGWDLRERFRAALEKSAGERREVEANLKRAEGALEWLSDFVDKVEKDEELVVAVEV